MSEKIDFVFLDAANRPYRVTHWGSTEDRELWLFYWHDSSGRWVSLWLVEASDLPRLRAERVLPQWQAELYHTLDKRHT